MSYTCPTCGAVSHNSNDEREKYCARCHAFENQRFLAICQNRAPPEPVSYKAGQDARSTGVPFHEGPRPFDTVSGLSWRLGWNDRSLQMHGDLESGA